MSVDRIATAQQSAYFLSQINQASAALDTTNQQIASQDVATTYAGFGDQTQVLTATISANARNDAYTTATTLATTQADMQDTQLTSLGTLGDPAQNAVSDAVANNDPTTLMGQVQSIFDQATAILNSKDANGDYIYSGGKTDTPPVTVSSLSALVALPSVSGAFANGDDKKSVQVADGQTVTFGVTASDVGTGLMQALEGHRRLRCRRRRQFHRQHQPQPGAERLPDRPDHLGRHRGHQSEHRHGPEWLCL